jgi:multiple antibiotic resistance protein
VILTEFIETSIYLLATINPPSKVFLLSSMDPPYGRRQMLDVCVRSSIVAFLILVVMACAGKLLLVNIFRIDLYSLRVAGGIVLMLVGLQAVTKGRFHEKAEMEKVSDLSIVPLAAPFIAGPGSITVAISIVSTSGMLMALSCIATAVLANLLIMLSSPLIGKSLEKVRAIGPCVRITGLVVMAMAVQMILAGLHDWLAPILAR